MNMIIIIIKIIVTIIIAINYLSVFAPVASVGKGHAQIPQHL